MQQVFKLEGSCLTFYCRSTLEEVNDLANFLKNNKEVIQKVKLEVEQNFATIYVLKKILGPNVNLETNSTKQESLFKYLNISMPKKQYFQKDMFFNPLLCIPKLFDTLVNNVSQNKFWIRNFFMAQRVLLLNGVQTNFIWFFTAGFTLSLTAYKQLLLYSLESEAYILVYVVMIRSICPIMSALLMTSKSCTALASSTKSMELGGEVKVLQLINLPLNSTYFHPIFIACIIITPILNIIAIISSIFGSMCCYLFTNYSFGVFISMYQNIFTISDLLDSLMKSLFFGIWIGIVTCSSAEYPGKSFQSIIGSVDACVTYSIMGFIIIQFIIEMVTKY